MKENATSVQRWNIRVIANKIEENAFRELGQIKEFMKKTIHLLIFCFLAVSALGQLNYSQELKMADRLLDEGYLDTLPKMLDNALLSKVKAERSRANIILTKAYLFKDNDSLAAVHYQNLLKDLPFYTPTENEPIDFKYFSNEFMTFPRYALTYNATVVSPKVSENMTHTVINSLFGSQYEEYISGEPEATISPVGLDASLFFLRNFELSAGFYLQNRKYSYKKRLQDTDPDGAIDYFDEVSMTESQSWSEIPIQLTANAFVRKRITPFIYYSRSVHWLYKASWELERQEYPDELAVTSPNILELRKKELWSSHIGGGLKIRLSDNYLKFQFGYRWFHQSFVNPANLYQNENAIYNYAFLDNEVRVPEMVFKVGYSYQFYMTKRRKRKLK